MTRLIALIPENTLPRARLNSAEFNSFLHSAKNVAHACDPLNYAFIPGGKSFSVDDPKSALHDNNAIVLTIVYGSQAAFKSGIGLSGDFNRLSQEFPNSETLQITLFKAFDGTNVIESCSRVENQDNGIERAVFSEKHMLDVISKFVSRVVPGQTGADLINAINSHQGRTENARQRLAAHHQRSAERVVAMPQRQMA